MKVKSREQASSLVTTLMVIVVLTIIVVAFLQSMSIERLTSKSYANKYQAELLADAATEDAIDRIFAAIEPKPYSATFASNNVGGRETRHLYLARYAVQSTNVVTERVPIFSTIFTNFAVFTNGFQLPVETNSLSVADVSPSGNSLTRTLTSASDIYTDFNRTNLSAPMGLVGLTNASGVITLPGNWIYQTNAQGKVIGRYAYWVDDETSKLDLRTAGAVARGNGTNLAEISVNSFTAAGLAGGEITNLFNFKSQTFSGKSIATVRYPLGGGIAITNSNNWNSIRPHLTQYSLHDLRSFDGNLSINLNQFVTTTNAAAAIQQQVETIAAAITNNLPSFGQRYYQSIGSGASPPVATPSAVDQAKYVKKIAANIRDYIDADNTATVIMGDGSAYTGTAPDFISGSGLYDDLIDDIPIVGKEKGPYLNEYALVTRIISPSPEPTATSGDVTIVVRFGHYIELFNPSSKDITYSMLGPNPRIIIANQTLWLNKKDNSNFRPADVRLDLPNNIVIPANGYVVITTDGTPFLGYNQTDFLCGPTGRYALTKGNGPGTWSLLGTAGQTIPSGSVHEDYTINTSNTSSDRYNVQMNSAQPHYSGCRERLLFVNDNGIIDYSLRIYTVSSSTPGNYMGRGSVRNPSAFSTFVSDGYTSNNNTNPESTAGAPRLVRGDPRSNTEITALEANTSASWKSGNSPQYGNNIGLLQTSLGTNNYNWNVSIGEGNNMWRDGWAEYSPSGNNFIANTNLTSVGELGFIYDPSRYNISWVRTYGRTLRVGQPDSKGNNRNNNSPAANDQNWIGGLGTNDVTSTNYLINAFHLASIFRSDDYDYGKINPNGMFRSGDRSLFASLFNGFSFQATNTTSSFQASGSLSGKAINTNAFYKTLTNELATNRPFIGVGDLSRLDLFATNSTTDSIATNQSMSLTTVSDGDREEVFRRTAGLLNTQSLSYSVYVVGQCGRFVTLNGVDVFKPSSTVRKATVVQFKPNYSSTNFPAKPSSWGIVKPWQINLN